MVLFRSNHFASQKRTSHTAKSDLLQLHKIQPPFFFLLFFHIFVKNCQTRRTQIGCKFSAHENCKCLSQIDFALYNQSYIRQLYVILCIVVLDKSKHPCAKVQPHQDGEKVLRDTQGHVTPMARDT